MPASTLLSLIGNTPLIELTHLSPQKGIRIFAKLEGQNPSGSIKDRITLAMVEEAEIRGELRAGDTIIEASSGNTAIALALIAKQRGYQVRVIIPGEVAPSIGDLLELYGAEIIWCEPKAGMKGAIDLAREMAQAQGYHYLGQFDNRINQETHYRTTGKEIVQALSQIDVLVAGIGTGGTITGVGQRLREANPNLQIVGVEPRMGEALQGLRSLSEGYVPPLLDLTLLNRRFMVDSATAIDATHLIVEKEGLLAGISSGATLYAALRVAKDMDEGNIVVMFSDGGWKYLPARPWDAAKAGTEDLDETHWW
ncbi:MAG: cysteine synthase family protein [Chloroflexi bacterium]|nr:cysteine synthase family protein [Chloroflexota bacterium]MDA1219176.1 cysteine synthase family protein [Chloroflexota bacterium]